MEVNDCRDLEAMCRGKQSVEPVLQWGSGLKDKCFWTAKSFQVASRGPACLVGVPPKVLSPIVRRNTPSTCRNHPEGTVRP